MNKYQQQQTHQDEAAHGFQQAPDGLWLPNTQVPVKLPQPQPTSNRVHWPERTLFGKSWWEWMSLLLVPLLIGLGTIWVTDRQTDAQNALSQQLHDSDTRQHQSDQSIAQQARFDDLLKEYRDGIDQLLLTNGLRTSHPDDDVRRIASSRTLDLTLWETSTGLERFSLKGHTVSTTGCTISPDSSFIVSSSLDGTLKLWDSSTGKERFSLVSYIKGVTSCAISPDSRFIVSAYVDNTLKVWDSSSGQERFSFTGHTGWISGCVFSPDGRFIVSASIDGSLKLWNSSTGQERLTLSGHTGEVRACAISPDGHFIVSASIDGTLKLWDPSSGQERLSLSGHNHWVNGCAVSPDSRFIISASEDHTLKLWESRTGQCLLTFPVDGRLFDCAFHPDGKHLVACGASGMYFLHLVM